MSTDQLERVKHTRDRALSARADFLARLERDSKGRENRQLTVDEDRQFKAFTEEIRDAQQRVVELEREEQYATRPSDGARIAAQTTAPAESSSVYRRESRHSYFADLVAQTRQAADYETRQRLQQYEQEQLERRDLNRSDGTGGVFVPPSFLWEQLATLPRPGRVLADLLNRQPLPGGTDQINIPKIVTGSAVGAQAADNDPIMEVDPTETSVSAPVRTIAGQVDVAIQLLDQSPINLDQLIMRDLLADYNTKLDQQVMSGAGTLGTLLGLRNVVGIETVTWTSASPTALELLRRVADAQQRIAGALYQSPDALIMHPRRWSWLMTQADAQSRPLVVPSTSGPSNALGSSTSSGAEGRVGELAGLSVYLDANVPTNINTNQDLILVVATSENLLFESTPRTRVLQETLSANLTIRLQLWNYCALATRQVKSVAVISGSALTPPTF